MRKIILGTDWWTDCDDAVALRLICRAIKDKAILLLGIGVNACMECSISSLKGFLKAEGVADIPVGIDLNATDFGGNPPYQKRLAEAFCPDALNSDAEDAVRLYRRILVSEKGKLDIIELFLFLCIFRFLPFLCLWLQLSWHPYPPLIVLPPHSLE